MTDNENNFHEIAYDLLKFLLCQLKEKNIAISHSKMQKTVFKIKMELGCNHPLYSQLPFYWAKEGPFSSIVAQVFSKLRNDNCNHFSSNTVFLDDDYYVDFSTNNTLIDEFPQIKKLSSKITDDKYLKKPPNYWIHQHHFPQLTSYNTFHLDIFKIILKIHEKFYKNSKQIFKH